MPITYEYNPSSNILHSYHSGRQTVSRICDFFLQVISDPTVKNGFIEVVHFADDIEFDLTGHTARKIPIYYSEMKNNKNLKATIFIAATQLQYGIARMMINLHGVFDPTHDVRVVRTPEETQREINSIILS
jgi:hypothetical protein